MSLIDTSLPQFRIFNEDESLRARYVLGLSWIGQAYLRDLSNMAEGKETGQLAYVDARVEYQFRCAIYGCVALINEEYYLKHCASKVRASHLAAARRWIRQEQKRARKMLS